MALQVIPGEVTNFTVTIAIFSGCILFFGYISLLVKERLFLSEAIVAVAVGVCVGPLGSNLMNPQEWQNYHEITKQLSRCVIAIQVMTVGIELPHRYMMKEWRTVSIFLLPVMIYMWVVSGTIIWGLIRPLSFLESLLISACICPTDPVLANSVVKGRFAMKKVPPNIRHLLAAESGANDGMGFPFLFLALFLIAEDTLANAVGAGWLAREVLKFSEENYLIDKPSFLSFTIALALFLMSMTGFTGSDDLLACFVAGNVFSWDKMFIREKDESHFQEVVDTMLNLSMFVYIGTIIPWQDFGNIEIGLEKWRLVLAAFLIIFLRRLPAVVLLQPITPAIRSYREAVFSGWFGPIGVGAVFLSTIAQEELENVYEGKDHPVSTKIIGPVVLYMVFFSVVVHGSTVALINFGKRVDYSSIPSSQTYSESEQPSKENDYEDTEIVENKKLTNEKGLDNLTALGNSGIIKPIVKYDKTPLLDINHTECDLSQSNLSQANTVTSRLSSLRNIASSSSSSSSRQLSVPSNSKMIPMRKLSTGSSKDHKELNGWFFTSASSYKKQAARKARRKELKKLKGIKVNSRVKKMKQRVNAFALYCNFV
ncbi:hypothetical protein G6F56_007850 [Rhizopus delemar]|nr:hypothetical protein G6F56_007850 [Rhizopus delemar]